ncbi:MAG: hypothetical protein IKR22_02510 [Clostridiales bacterium]|nr:hypothetical protein [Clostridiales bacterium]
MKKRLIGITSIVLSLTLLLSSCVSKEKKKEDTDADLDEDVVEIVDGYFSQITDMSFSKTDKYADTSSFSDLDLSSDEFDVVNALMGTVKYEITKTDIDEENDKGKATVKMTYADLDAVLEGFDGQADADSIIEAIKDKNVKTVSKTVKVNLVRDKEWKIVDDAPIFDAVLSSLDKIDKRIHPVETSPAPTTMTTFEPTTMTTEEPTTTTEEETTTTTTKATSDTSDTQDTSKDTSSSDPTGTNPNPPAEHQILVGDELDKLLKDFGFKATTDSSTGVKGIDYTYQDDFEMMYFETTDISMSKTIFDQFANELRAKKSDCQEIKESTYLKTLNIYLIKMKSQGDHSYDFYLYYDESVVLIAGINEYPDADVCVDYYVLLDKIGLWDFDVDDWT